MSGAQVHGCLALAVLLLMGSAMSVTTEEYIKQNGDMLTLKCNGDDTSGDSIKWTHNGREAIGYDTQYQSSNKKYTATLTAQNLQQNDSGIFACETSNGLKVKEFDVTVVQISGDDVILNGTKATFDCQVESTDVTIKSFKWRNGGKELDSDGEKYTIKTDNSSTMLNLNGINASDAGVYACVVSMEVKGKNKTFEHPFSLNVKPTVLPIDKLRSKVEDETAKIECKVTGFPVPSITWFRKLEGKEAFELIKYDDRINVTENSEKVPHAKLVITKLKIEKDRGIYKCVAVNEFGESETIVELKVKDKLAAVWPFLGIVAEVFILCSIIFIFEKRRSRKLEEEEEVDAVKQDLMGNANNEEKEVRQRNTART